MCVCMFACMCIYIPKNSSTLKYRQFLMFCVNTVSNTNSVIKTSISKRYQLFWTLKLLNCLIVRINIFCIFKTKNFSYYQNFLQLYNAYN